MKGETLEELVNHLKKFNDEDVIIKAKLKKSIRPSKAQQDDFRGSRYRGVSKNKGKWQVKI